MKVLITRPIADGARTAARLEEDGHEPIIAPVTKIEHREVKVLDGAFDAVLISSANAIRALSEAARVKLAAVPVFCVGEKTAKTAREAGFREITTGSGNGHALVERVTAMLKPTARLLYLTGTPRKPFIEDGLKQSGYKIDVLELYRTVPVSPWPDASAIEIKHCDCALHFSRSSVEILLDAAQKAGLLNVILGLKQICLSDDVAVPLREKGVTDILIAPHPREEDLFALLHIKET